MPRVRLLLVDACVLIDFAKADSSVLTLAARHVGEVHVATPVFEEVKDLDPAMAASLSLKLYEPTLEMVAAAATTRGRLSFQDRLSVVIARENGWTCVSNDKQLRATCKADGIPVLWGFEVLGALVERQALSPAAAAAVAKKISAANHHIGRDVLLRFLAKIGVK